MDMRGARTERGTAVTVQGVKDKEVIAAELAAAKAHLSATPLLARCCCVGALRWHLLYTWITPKIT